MKFNREDLIGRVKAKRQAVITKAQLAFEENERKEQERLDAEMLERDLGPLINLLRRARDNGTPLTSKDFDDLGIKGVRSDGWSTRVVLQSPIIGTKKSVQKPEEVNTSGYDALIDFLEAATDREVTSSALVNHGFRNFTRFI